MTLLADELVPGGKTILEIGLDHYYRGPEMHLKTFALANLALKELNP